MQRGGGIFIKAFKQPVLDALTHYGCDQTERRAGPRAVHNAQDCLNALPPERPGTRSVETMAT